MAHAPPRSPRSTLPSHYASPVSPVASSKSAIPTPFSVSSISSSSTCDSDKSTNCSSYVSPYFTPGYVDTESDIDEDDAYDSNTETDSSPDNYSDSDTLFIDEGLDPEDIIDMRSPASSDNEDTSVTSPPYTQKQHYSPPTTPRYARSYYNTYNKRNVRRKLF